MSTEVDLFEVSYTFKDGKLVKVLIPPKGPHIIDASPSYSERRAVAFGLLQGGVLAAQVRAVHDEGEIMAAISALMNQVMEGE